MLAPPRSGPLDVNLDSRSTQAVGEDDGPAGRPLAYSFEGRRTGDGLQDQSPLI